MVLLEAYTGGVPADAWKKETRDPELIRLASSQLKQLKIQRAASNDDVPCGGIGLYLRFSRADGSSETVHLGANGDLLLTGAGFYKLRRPLDPAASGAPWTEKKYPFPNRSSRRSAAGEFDSFKSNKPR